MHLLDLLNQLLRGCPVLQVNLQDQVYYLLRLWHQFHLVCQLHQSIPLRPLALYYLLHQLHLSLLRQLSQRLLHQLLLLRPLALYCQLRQLGLCPQQDQLRQNL